MDVFINGDSALGQYALLIVGYTEPTTKKDGTPIDDLKAINFYAEYAPFGITNPISRDASSATGGTFQQNSQPLNIPLGTVVTVKVWGEAVNLKGQISDKSEIHEILVDRTALDPMKAPMPPQ